jgi:hypothetical protein
MTGFASQVKAIKSRGASLLLLLLFFVLCGYRTGVSKENLNYAVHARFVYHFVKYLNWPQPSKGNAKEPFILGVWGNKPMLTELTQACAGKKIEDRPLEVRSVNQIAEAEKCELVFLAEKEHDQLESLAKAVYNEPVVIVSEYPGSIAQGADINFVIREDRLRFELNPSRLQRKSIQIAGELKRLAIISSTP